MKIPCQEICKAKEERAVGEVAAVETLETVTMTCSTDEDPASAMAASTTVREPMAEILAQREKALLDLKVDLVPAVARPAMTAHWAVAKALLTMLPMAETWEAAGRALLFLETEEQVVLMLMATRGSTVARMTTASLETENAVMMIPMLVVLEKAAAMETILMGAKEAEDSPETMMELLIPITGRAVA